LLSGEALRAGDDSEQNPIIHLAFSAVRGSTWANAGSRDAFCDGIDFAVTQLGVESFASLDSNVRYGEHAFYAMGLERVREGVLADVRPTRARDQLLTALELAAGWPGLRVVDGDALDPAAATEVGKVGAVFLANVLLHAVAPDWDDVLDLYAPRTSAFVIANPQWSGSHESVRLPWLERERYLAVMPPAAVRGGVYDRLDEWYPAQQRPLREARTIWQWGITDADLEGKLAGLGFELAFRQTLGPVSGTESFSHTSFVFTRSG
jgi:hypothetical protein